MTNEILCVYYDCSGFDFDKSELIIDIGGPINIVRYNKVGKIDDYFDNYEFSYKIKINKLVLNANADRSLIGSF